MLLKLYKAYKEGQFLPSRAAGSLGSTYRSIACKTPSVEAISTALYEWYLRTPPHARKGRASFYRRIRILHTAYLEQCKKEKREPEKFGGMSRRNRRRWLDMWAKSKGISFRVLDKKFKLSRDDWLKRLGMYWRDCIRVRYQLGDPPFVGWDETPFFADSLDDLETAVTKGVYTVAINSNHGATNQIHGTSWNV